jgi:hypothetical protein
MKLNPEALARASSHHPWRTLTIWLVLIVTMGVVSGALLSGVLSQDISFTNRPESVQAQDVLDAKFPSQGGNGQGAADSTEYVIITSDSLTVDDPAFQAFAKGVQATLATSLARRPRWCPRTRRRPSSRCR